MKAAYQVIGTRPVCIDFDDGRSMSFPVGASFSVDSSNVQVQRLLRGNEVREMARNERGVQTIDMTGHSPAVESLMKARQSRIAAAAATKPSVKGLTPLNQKKGEAIQAPKKSFENK